MERHAFAMKVKEGKMNDYRKILGEIWPELTAYSRRNGPSIIQHLECGRPCIRILRKCRRIGDLSGRRESKGSID